MGGNLRRRSVSKYARFSGLPAPPASRSGKLPQIISSPVLTNQRLAISVPVDFLRKTAMVFGYARVSASDQQLHLQTDASQTYGCTEVVRGKAGSKK